jgi:hypothetical protein
MEDEDNGLWASGLLSRLHNFYRPGRRSYRKEDLFTEYLAWLLNRSRRFRIAFAELALDKSAGMSPEGFSEAVALTQVDTGDWGRIDLMLEVAAPADDGAAHDSPQVEARLGIECKIDLTLGEEQPRRYHEWLEEEAERCRHVALAALTKKRLGQQSPFAGVEPRFWQGRVHWHEVERELERCVKEVRSEQLPELDPDEDDFVDSAGFVVIGGELRDLMREEGMLAASKIDAADDADLYRASERYKDRVDEILSLVEQAIDTAGIDTLLQGNDETEDLPRTHKKNLSKGRPVSVIYHRDDPPARFMFGVMVSPPNRYARRSGERVPSDAYKAELVAGYKLLDGSGGSLQMHDDLKEIADLLTAAVPDRPGPDVEVFVPENASYQKFVARADVPTVDSAEDQAQAMGHFYRDFVSAFVEAEGPGGRSMLERLRDLHLEAVGGE